MNRRVLIAARIAMSLVGIVYIFSFWRQLDFTWHGQPQWLGHVLCWTTIVALLARGGGWGGWFQDRLLSVLHLVAAEWLLFHSFPYPTVNEGLYLTLAFWCCFMQLNPGRGDVVPAWPSVLLGVNVAICIFTAGLDKCNDELWQRGYGFYYFLNLAWLRPPSADWMMRHVWLLEIVNYAGLLMELGALPLMIFRRTRLAACIVMAGFFASLIWPCRMDMIGPVGLCIVLVVLAGSFARSELRMSALGWCMAAYVFIAGSFDVTSALAIGKPAYPMARMWQVVNDGIGAWYPDGARFVNEHVTFMTPNSLFSSPQVTGIWAFRVVVTMPDGARVEPVRVFNADRTGGCDTQGFACTRHYQACIYQLSDYARSNGDGPTESVDVLMRHAMRRAGGGASATLLVSSLEKVFDGKWKPVRTIKSCASPLATTSPSELVQFGQMATP
jgi:hypothetical protein